MRKSLSILAVLTALPSLALAQSLFTLSPSPPPEGPLPEALLHPTGSLAMAARSGDRLRVDSGFRLPEREFRQWTMKLEPALRPIALGEGELQLSGPLVDTFRLKARTEVRPDRSRLQKILDLPIVNLFVPQPWPKPDRTIPYFAWGEGDRPWMLVCDRHHDGERGAWLTIR